MTKPEHILAFKKSSKFIKAAINILRKENLSLDVIQTLESIYNNFVIRGNK